MQFQPKEHWRQLLALHQFHEMGSQKFFKILKKTPDPNEWFRGSECLVHPGQVDWNQVDQAIAWSEKDHCVILSYWDPQYPAYLKEIRSPPLMLFVQGQLSWLSKPQIAMVGSRNPTPMGNAVAKDFAHYFSSLGITITSGLAQGIDTICHWAALPELGGTIAVLGHGLNYIYPSTNRDLSRLIAENGALISEFPLPWLPKPILFPKRNRIISGLSLGTLVIEATIKSGSLITAKFALEQGREVFAIPGSIYSPQSRGCHSLIRQGAKLVEKAEDIIEELTNFFPHLIKKNQLDNKKMSLPCLSPLYKSVLSKIGFETTSLDDLSKRCKLTIQEVSIMLLELELRGYINAVPGGFIKCPPVAVQKT